MSVKRMNMSHTKTCQPSKRCTSTILSALLVILQFLAACAEVSPAAPPVDVEPAGNPVGPAPAITATMIAETHSATDTPTTVPPTATETMTLLPTLVPTAIPMTHIVKELETLSTIADQYGVTVAALQAANDINDPNLIYPGQELVIPSAPADESERLETGSPAPAAGELNATPVPQNTAEVTAVATEPVEGEPAGVDPTAPVEAARGILHNGVLCPTEIQPVPAGAELVGYSAVCQLPIVSYRLGNGDIPLILVGGMHGGYEWNTITLAFDMLDHLQKNPDLIPPSLTVYLIPDANPDGLYMVAKKTGPVDGSDILTDTVAGRFNGRKVDLNRNWDCNWSATAIWRDNPISGGSAPFSEPENQALRQFFEGINPAVILFWHSAARGVYAAGCGEVDPPSKALAQVYGQASGYPVYDSFQHYDVTGDASDWLSAQNLPSFTVELATHETTDWEMNLAGLKALFQHVAGE